MHLYEYRTKQGEVSEIVADQHVDAWDFYLAVKRTFGIDIHAGNISYMWEQRFKGTERVRASDKLWGAVPVTVGIVE